MGKEGTECWGQRGPSGTGHGPGRATSVVVMLKQNYSFIHPGISVLVIYVIGNNNIGVTELILWNMLQEVRQGIEQMIRQVLNLHISQTFLLIWQKILAHHSLQVDRVNFDL